MMQFDGTNQNMYDAMSNLKEAHAKIKQAQQKIDNRELNEQRLLEEALDAINNAQTALTKMK